MKKLLMCGAVAAMFGAMIPAAQAAATSNNFNVSVTLTSMCEVTNNSTQTLSFGTYQAFQTLPQASAAPVSLAFRCTRGFAPTSTAFDTTLGNAAGVGVLVGLQYALTTAAAVTVGGTAASTATIGTGDAVTYSVSGSMPADQAGACAGSSCGPTSHIRTLIVTF